MLDDLNELKTFRAILGEGSLSGAARRLGVTLAVVSKRLATLEGRTGVRLINRTTRTLSPTEDGARLLVDVSRALEALETSESRMVGGRDEPAGLLRIGAPVSFGRRCVAPVLGRMTARYPRLNVALELDDQVVDLVREGFDVAIRIGPLADSTAVMRKLADNRRILVAAPDYLDRAGHPAAPEDLAGHALLRYGASLAPWRLQGPGERSFTLAAPARLRVDNGDVVHDWALAGHGIMLKSEVDVAEDLGTGRLAQVLPDWTGGSAPVVALFPSAEHQPLKLRAFLDELARHVASTMDNRHGRVKAAQRANGGASAGGFP